MSTLSDKVKYFAKLSSIGIFTFIKIHLLAIVTTIIVLIIGFILLSKGVDTENSEHVSILSHLTIMFTKKPVGTILLLSILCGSPYLYFLFGNKYILNKIIHKIVKDKSEKYICPLLNKALEKINISQSTAVQKGFDYSMVKLQLIREIQHEPENKWIKKAIVFGIKQTPLNYVDLGEESISFNNFIQLNVIKTLESISEPSKKLIWIIVAIQWLLLLLIWILPY